MKNISPSSWILLVLIVSILVLGTTLIITAPSVFPEYFKEGKLGELHEKGFWGKKFNSHPGFHHHFPAKLIPFLIIGSIIVLIVVKKRGYHLPHTRFHHSALDILKEKYARGEISTEEYEERKKILKHKEA